MSLQNTTTNGRTILKTYAINDVVVGGIIKDDDVMKKERVFL
jgi:phosphosulfolactate phosphohydrolase-like enzyme